MLYPKNGRSCKQLAILAVMTHRRLDAIYYYVRALATTSLNDSVKQNLIVLFEEARRRVRTFLFASSTNFSSSSSVGNLRKRIERSREEKREKDPCRFERRVDVRMERKIFSPFAGNQKLEIWKKIDGTVLGRSLDDGHSHNDQNDFDASVSQQEVRLTLLSSHERVFLSLHSWSIGSSWITSLYTANCTRELGSWSIFSSVLFTFRIDSIFRMETYTELCSRMLRQFQTLLRHDPCVFGKQQLVQMMAINMYQIEVGKQKSVSSRRADLWNRFSSNWFSRLTADVVVRSQYEESSLQLALDMFGLLTEQTSIVVERHLRSRSIRMHADEHPTIFNSWMRHVFPSLKIFTDWMTCNVRTFVPLPDQLPAEYGPHPDILRSLAKVINRIRTIDRTHIQIGPNLPSRRTKSSSTNVRRIDSLLLDSVPVILEEDIEMSGFYPLLTLPADNLQTTSDTSLVRTDRFDEGITSNRSFRTRQRIANALLVSASSLIISVAFQKPIFIYDVQQRIYQPVLKSSIHSERSKSPTHRSLVNFSSRWSINRSSLFQNASIEYESQMNEPSSPIGNSSGADPSSPDVLVNGVDMKELKRKKRLLENQLAERQKQEQVVKVRETLRSTFTSTERRSFSLQDILNTSRLIEIEVVPRYIVLDTNCFVNYLPIIYKLIKQGRFTIIIPLIGSFDLSTKIADRLFRFSQWSANWINFRWRRSSTTIRMSTPKWFVDNRFKRWKWSKSFLPTKRNEFKRWPAKEPFSIRFNFAMKCRKMSVTSIFFSARLSSSFVLLQESNDDTILGCCLKYVSFHTDWATSDVKVFLFSAMTIHENSFRRTKVSWSIYSFRMKNFFFSRWSDPAASWRRFDHWRS